MFILQLEPRSNEYWMFGTSKRCRNKKAGLYHVNMKINIGTHAELVADTIGKYSELWNSQVQYYIVKTI